MTPKGPFDLVRQMAEILDELGVPYALGGSMASSLLGEPRSTVDVDLAVQLDERSGEALLLPPRRSPCRFSLRHARWRGGVRPGAGGGGF